MRNLIQFDYMIDSYEFNGEGCNELRASFIRRFTWSVIKNMTLDEYVLGKGGCHTFCWWLDYGLASLGEISGRSFSNKWGIYYDKHTESYRCTEKWGSAYDGDFTPAFRDIKEAILAVLASGRDHDITAIAQNKLANIVKYKLLSVYYPYQYLNIFASNHLNYFLYQFYGDAYDYANKSILQKQSDLIVLKEDDLALRHWDNIKFGNYLYHLFPNAPKEAQYDKYQQVTPKDKTVKAQSPKPTVEDKRLASPLGSAKHSSQKSRSKADYVENEKRAMKIGMRGEQLVVQAEKERLGKDHPELARQVEQVSLISDSYGYDIKSFESDGRPRYIEVKTTPDHYQPQFSFLLTENERRTASQSDNYWLYRVFDINDAPQIIRLKDPLGDQRKCKLSPTQYRVTLRVK